MFDLKGKSAIITGAASGIGAAAAHMFHELGANVTIIDVQVEPGEALAAELGGTARFSRLDVTNEDDWARVVEKAEAAFGPINILVNNAGHAGHQKPMSELTLEEYRLDCSINQDGVFLGMKHVQASMQRAGGGSIVNNSSGYGLIGVANLMDYVASKWAVTGMTKAAAVELAPFNIRVNSVHPALMLTPDGGADDEKTRLGRRRLHRPNAFEPGRCTVRSRERLCVPGVRRGQFRNGSRTARRRRADGAIGGVRPDH